MEKLIITVAITAADMGKRQIPIFPSNPRNRLSRRSNAGTLERQ